MIVLMLVEDVGGMSFLDCWVMDLCFGVLCDLGFVLCDLVFVFVVLFCVLLFLVGVESGSVGGFVGWVWGGFWGGWSSEWVWVVVGSVMEMV